MKGAHNQKSSRTKCFAYIAAFVVFQAIIILVFALTIMKIKSPKLRFGSVVVQNFNNGGGTTNSASVSMSVVAQVSVKNTNFGHFKYENTTATISYGGVAVGEFFIPKGRTDARETKRFNVTIDLTSEKLSANPNLETDINSGFLALTSEAKLSGKVHLMKVIKKKKSAEMSCNMVVNLANGSVQELKCK